MEQVSCTSAAARIVERKTWVAHSQPFQAFIATRVGLNVEFEVLYLLAGETIRLIRRGVNGILTTYRAGSI